MKTSELKISIVAENALVVNGLRHDLQNRFGSAVEVSCFYDFKTCLKSVKKDTDVVVVDQFLDGKKGNDVLRSVKLINPNTTGIFHTSSEEVILSLQRLIGGVPKASGESNYSYNSNGRF